MQLEQEERGNEKTELENRIKEIQRQLEQAEGFGNNKVEVMSQKILSLEKQLDAKNEAIHKLQTPLEGHGGYLEDLMQSDEEEATGTPLKELEQHFEQQLDLEELVSQGHCPRCSNLKMELDS